MKGLRLGQAVDGTRDFTKVLHVLFDGLFSMCCWIEFNTKIPFIFKAVESLLRVGEVFPKVLDFLARNFGAQQEASLIIISPHEHSRTFLARACRSSCSL